MTIKVELFGKFYDNHSFSIINRHLLKELTKIPTLDVYISTVDNYDPKYKVDKDIISLIEEYKEKRTKLANPPDMLVIHTYPPVWRWPQSDKTKIIYYQHWEYPKIPMEWQYKWEQYADAVCCSSVWTKENIVNAGMDPNNLHVVKPGVDTSLFNNTKKESNYINTDKYVFTFVGCSQFRKGIDILLEGWVGSFAKADKVLLFIKDNPYVYGQSPLLNEIINLQYKHSCAEIIYCDDILSEEEMANVYKNSDVIVHPYRGEGFGMHIQEALACGAVPLVTRGGAVDDIVTPECGLLINSGTRFIDYTDPSVFAVKPGDSLTSMGEHGWVIEPDKGDFMTKMKSLYFQHNRESTKQLTEKAKITKWSETASQLNEVIERTLNDISEVPKRIRSR